MGLYNMPSMDDAKVKANLGQFQKENNHNAPLTGGLVDDFLVYVLHVAHAGGHEQHLTASGAATELRGQEAVPGLEEDAPQQRFSCTLCCQSGGTTAVSQEAEEHSSTSCPENACRYVSGQLHTRSAHTCILIALKMISTYWLRLVSSPDPTLSRGETVW